MTGHEKLATEVLGDEISNRKFALLIFKMLKDESLFWSRIEAHLLDHGVGQPILAAHNIKTAFAVRAEAAELPVPERTRLYQGLWRYLTTPAKQKHLWRTMHQSLTLISRDFPQAVQDH